MKKIKVYQYPKYNKNIIYDLKQDINNHIEIDYNYLIKEEFNRLYMSEDIYRLQDSTLSFQKLLDITKSKRGIEGYKYKYSDKPNGDKWEPFFTGQVYRYFAISEVNKWVELLGNEKSDYLDYFKGEKILIRRIISRKNRLQSMITNDDLLIGKDLYSFKITDKSFNIKYLLGVLNSTLISYLYYMRSTVAQKDDFRQTTLEEIRQLPIVKADEEVQQKIVKIVDRLINFKKEIYQLNFKEDIENYYTKQISNKIELSKLIRWDQLIIGREKIIIDKIKRYGIIYNIEIKDDGNWCVFIINGKQITDQSKEIELTSNELFSVLDLDVHVKEFIIHHLKKIKNIDTKKKTMLDFVLDIKIPEFDSSRPQNLIEIKKIMNIYNQTFSLFNNKLSEMHNAEAEIDAIIFKLYGVSPSSIGLILDSLGRDATTNISLNPEINLDEEYNSLILKYLNEN
jgi:hypothetical protein